MRAFLSLVLVVWGFVAAKAQTTEDNAAKLDTITPAGYINQGKIAGRKAVGRSLIFPGLGQLYNYGLVVDDVQNGRVQGKKIGQKIYIIGKIGALYAGGTMLVMSYIDNNNKYNLSLKDLQYRQLHNDQPNPDYGFAQYPTSSLTIAKAVYKRNREIVIISLVGLYGLNVLDAYVAARLHYFNVDETLSLKLSPTIIQSSTMYGFNNIVPALKLTLSL